MSLSGGSLVDSLLKLKLRPVPAMARFSPRASLPALYSLRDSFALVKLLGRRTRDQNYLKAFRLAPAVSLSHVTCRLMPSGLAFPASSGITIPERKTPPGLSHGCQVPVPRRRRDRDCREVSQRPHPWTQASRSLQAPGLHAAGPCQWAAGIGGPGACMRVAGYTVPTRVACSGRLATPAILPLFSPLLA